MRSHLPVHELKACADGTGYYEGLAQDVRYEQLGLLAGFCHEMFPKLRLFLFDAHQVFSAPVTVFGPKLAVIYIGQFFLAFREGQRVRSITDHFDRLVREAVVDARDVAGHVNALIGK